MSLKRFPVSETERSALRSALLSKPEVFSIKTDPEFCYRLICLGIHREVGTVNDELSRFIFDDKPEQVVPRESLRSEIVKYKGQSAVKIWSEQSSSLDLRAKGFYQLVCPNLGKNEDGSLKFLLVIPSVVQKIAAFQKIDLVIVRQWAMNSIFGNFDPSKSYYQTNYWELEHNDSVQFAQLVQRNQLAFLGTHDLIAHIAAADRSHWPLLRRMATDVEKTIDDYLNSEKKPTICSLILPYTAGVILDDLAQPPSYGSSSHIKLLQVVLRAMKEKWIPANRQMILGKFPKGFQKVVDLSRCRDLEKVDREKFKLVKSMCDETLSSAFSFAK